MLFEHEAFDRLLRSRSARLDCHPEQTSDLPFVHRLAARCSPLAFLVPEPVLQQQAEAQEASHRAHHPNAMRRVVTVDGAPAARIVVDWAPSHVAHGVDIAVLPELRSSGAGLHMLRAWLDAADEGAWECVLEVNRDNPAMRLYAYLGFQAADDRSVGATPFVSMNRLASPMRVP